MICVTCSDRFGVGWWLSPSEAQQHKDFQPHHEIIDEEAEAMSPERRANEFQKAMLRRRSDQPGRRKTDYCAMIAGPSKKKKPGSWKGLLAILTVGFLLAVIGISLTSCAARHSHEYTMDNWREAPKESIGVYCTRCDEMYFEVPNQ